MTPSVDLPVSDRPPAWQAWAVPPLATAYAAALVVVQGGNWPALLGPLGWWLVGCVAVVSLLGTGVTRLREPAPRQVAARRIQHALRAHVDPGPELRERADRQAASLAGHRWVAAFLVVAPLLFVDSAPWDRAVLAGVAVAALVVLFAALAVTVARSARDARRWLTDPPGPPRVLPPAPPWQRVLPVVVAAGAICVVAAFLLGLVAS
ncbi:hypothetical protein [Modestobacter roseus]|uniref:Uncharacterized protein n=1 Tax=Modestobacter roseus TaxID=1181884 RepID=A0A562IPA1_9ACTN|nr:hypothetical protein [Modestobacter roseus]MQA34212.1 hypothetical protein [Modestobacter roseus]TWH72533.1 hypothetical protein JD78_01049 [Modestobacter roseus]